MTPLLLLAFALPARAQEPLPLDPPQPVHGQPAPALALAWDLPPQDPAWLVEGQAELRCRVRVQVDAGGAAAPELVDCPGPLGPVALGAAGRWRFAPAAAPTLVELVFVVRYSEAIGAMTLHAELDPGQAGAEGEGRPGLRLVHEARPLAPLELRVPAKIRKRGQGAADCSFRARVASSGQVIETLVVACPEPLQADATRRLLKADFAPTRVDGQAQEDVVDVVLRYTP